MFKLMIKYDIFKKKFYMEPVVAFLTLTKFKISNVMHMKCKNIFFVYKNLVSRKKNLTLFSINIYIN